MRRKEIDRPTLIGHGWEQGGIFAVDAYVHLKSALNIDEIRDGDCCIVVSQSCDVLHDTLDDEPWIEVIIARPVTNPEPMKLNARNPRWLQFSVKVNGILNTFEVSSSSRYFLDRLVLEKYAADETRTLPPEARNALVRWLVGRYSRTALPDNFNLRIRSAQGSLHDLLKKLPTLRGLYIAIEPLGELNTLDEDYKIRVVALMAHEKFRDAYLKTTVTQHIEHFAARLRKCKGIRLEKVVVESDASLTVAELDHLIVLNYEYLTLRDPSNQEPRVRNGRT